MNRPPFPPPPSLPPQPSASSIPPEPSEASLPPEPSEASLPPEPSEASLPPEPSEASLPPEPSEASLPPEPSASSAPLEPSEASLPPQPSTPLEPPWLTDLLRALSDSSWQERQKARVHLLTFPDLRSWQTSLAERLPTLPSLGFQNALPLLASLPRPLPLDLLSSLSLRLSAASDDPLHLRLDGLRLLGWAVEDLPAARPRWPDAQGRPSAAEATDRGSRGDTPLVGGVGGEALHTPDALLLRDIRTLAREGRGLPELLRALAYLGSLGGEAYPEIRPWLFEGSDEEKARIIGWLSGLPRLSEEMLGDLLRVSLGLEPFWLRQRASTTLAAFRPPLETLSPLTSGLQATDENLRSKSLQAALALESADLQPFQPCLVERLDDPSQKVRRYALLGLGKIGLPAERDLPHLLRKLHEREPSSRKALFRALSDFQTLLAPLCPWRSAFLAGLLTSAERTTFADILLARLQAFQTPESSTFSSLLSPEASEVSERPEGTPFQTPYGSAEAELRRGAAILRLFAKASAERALWLEKQAGRPAPAAWWSVCEALPQARLDEDAWLRATLEDLLPKTLSPPDRLESPASQSDDAEDRTHAAAFSPADTAFPPPAVAHAYSFVALYWAFQAAVSSKPLASAFRSALATAQTALWGRLSLLPLPAQRAKAEARSDKEHSLQIARLYRLLQDAYPLPSYLTEIPDVRADS